MGMGERKLRAKQFQQKTDKVVAEEVKEANLFSEKLVESDLTYECIRDPDNAPVKTGQTVRLVDMKDRVDAFVGTKPVGYVVTSHAENLRATLRLAERKGRSIKGHIIDVSEITPTFIVRVDK